MARAQIRRVSRANADATGRQSFARATEAMPMPNLNQVQRDSFNWFLKEGLKELFAEVSPITRRREQDL
jgi:DNA-directed RNA polymerase subunit beta